MIFTNVDIFALNHNNPYQAKKWPYRNSQIQNSIVNLHFVSMAYIQIYSKCVFKWTKSKTNRCAHIPNTFIPIVVAFSVKPDEYIKVIHTKLTYHNFLVSKINKNKEKLIYSNVFFIVIVCVCCGCTVLIFFKRIIFDCWWCVLLYCE